MIRPNQRRRLWFVACGAALWPLDALAQDPTTAEVKDLAQPSAAAPATAPAATPARVAARPASAPEVATPPPASPATNAMAAPEQPTAQPRVIRLSAQQAVEQALRVSPTLRATAFDAQGAAEQVRVELGRYPYSLVADAGLTRSQTPQLRADDTVAASVSHSVDASVGVQRVFPFGAVAEVRATEQYFNSDTQAISVSPFVQADAGHSATLRASITQPLMRGFGTTVGEADLRVARSNLDGSERALTRAHSALARDVLAAYYELWYSARALEIDSAALELARQQEYQANQRVEVGDLALAEVLTFQTRSAELEEAVIASRLTQRQRSIALSQLMGQISADPLEFVPVSEPEVLPALPPVATVERAIGAESVELAELEAQVHSAEIRASVAGDAARPRLDGNAYVQTNGMSEGLPTAWQRASGLNWWSAHVGLSLELPLTGSRQEAQAAQAQFNVLSTRAQLTAARQQVTANAVTALETARAARDRLSSSERTLAIAERAYQAALARFELGQTAAISLQQAEDDLRRARLRAVRARVDIAQQQVQLEHLTGELVRRYPEQH